MGVLMAGTTLGYFMKELAIAQLENLAEDRNQGLTQVFRTLLAEDIEGLLQSPLNQGPAPILSRPALAALQSKIATVMHDADVVKLKLYNLQGRTVYATDTSQIGEDKSSNPGFQRAKGGNVASELTHRDQLSSFENSVSNVDLVSSYVPVRDQGQVVAVFELYQDVTPLMQRIKRSLWQLAGVLCLVLGSLYTMLLIIVRRANNAQRAQEALLEDANRQLDLRVAQRTHELSLSEERFRSLTEMSSDFYWESDARHRFTKRTPSKRESQDKQFQPSSFLGRLRWEVSHVAPDEATWQAHRAVLEAHLPFRDFEIARLDEQGLVHYLSASGDPVFDALGGFCGYRGVGSDITERKQAEADLRIAATAFESQEAMMVTDAQSRILRVNRVFEEVTGYSSAEIVGQTPRLLKSGRHDAQFYRTLWDTLTNTGRWQGEIWDRRKNGEIYPKWITISAVKNDLGRVTHFVGTHFDISERKKAEDRIADLAFYDPLTHLPNRTLLQERLKQALATSQREGRCGAALFIDLDHFKTLNDTQGHDQGDALLQQVAQRLLTCVRASDTVARLGGDEFVLIIDSLPDNPQEAAKLVEALGQKVLAALCQTYRLGDMDHHMTASMGATLFYGHQVSMEEVLKQADLAMYKSKEKGRNALSFFDPAMQTLVLERAALEQDLRRALADKQFVLHYQALVGKGQAVAGAEALIRWQHPQRGMVSPADFIPIAEDTGLILPLGHWVLQTACRQLALWATQPAMAHLTLAVNVSAHQFRQPDFTPQVLAVLAQTGADPGRLKLELTESLLIHNLDDIIAKMTALKAVGVSFSLDDFGTGYSSLSNLSRLPLDQVKIDRSFVMQIESDDNAVAICAATISLAHSLKLKVVAEGVETEAQRYFLSTVHQCDFLQGYLLARPLPLDQFETFVTRA
jgi:diguanylate cyclase (GGDEF)-like protein/PAS domain S-box-containing protein